MPLARWQRLKIAGTGHLIDRFATLDAWSAKASHPCIILMIMEARLRLAVD